MNSFGALHTAYKPFIFPVFLFLLNRIYISRVAERQCSRSEYYTIQIIKYAKKFKLFKYPESTSSSILNRIKTPQASAGCIFHIGLAHCLDKCSFQL